VVAPLLKCRNERSEFYGSKEGLGEILLINARKIEQKKCFIFYKNLL